MVERIDHFETGADGAPDWYLQPGDLIVPSIANLIGAVPVFRKLFGQAIEPYMRMDFGVRDFPAIRIYAPTGRTESVTWYLNGEVKMDVIFPPSIRRTRLQRFPDLTTSALLAQFRRQSFFDAMRELVPGLNELGKVFSFDKNLMFKPSDSNEPAPMAQITIGYRVLLDEWNRYLETDDRTPDEPFSKTLGDLERMAIEVEAQDDNGTVAVTTPVNVKP